MLKTAGELLRQERLDNKLTLDDIEKTTRIRKKNLNAIENGDWTQFPSRTYIQGIIVSYGSFLKLDTEKLLAYFRREYAERESSKFKTKVTKEQFAPQTKKFIRLLAISIIMLFILYFGFQLRNLFKPPTISILEPKKTEFKKEKKILLRGSTAKETQIFVNQERVFLNDENIFETEIPLVKDRNPVLIKAIGANGQEKELELLFTKIEKD